MITAYEIKSKSHLGESSNLCREYFKECGLTYKDVNGDNLLALRRSINKICFELADKPDWNLIKDLEVNSKIRWKKNTGGYLTIKGSYFDSREAVSFNRDGFIGFCGWASGCNRVPIIEGFVNWCDWMKSPKHNLNLEGEQGDCHQMAQVTEMEKGEIKKPHLEGITPKGVTCAKPSNKTSEDKDEN